MLPIPAPPKSGVRHCMLIKSCRFTRFLRAKNTGRRPTDDIQWVREEIHIWIFSNLARKWQTISNRPVKFFRMFSGYHCKDEVVRAALARVGVTEKDLVGSVLAAGLNFVRPYVPRV